MGNQCITVGFLQHTYTFAFVCIYITGEIKYLP